jgi:NADH-quinone oxidoreductase subunit M
MGGFWSKVPFMGTIALIFAMASLGLPGLGNFIAEFLTLIGAWQANPVLTIFATAGLVAATAYSLRIVQKVFLGEAKSGTVLQDLSLREKLTMVPMVIVIIWLGLFPQPILDTAKKTITGLHPQSHARSLGPSSGPSRIVALKPPLLSRGIPDVRSKGGSHE